MTPVRLSPVRVYQVGRDAWCYFARGRWCVGRVVTLDEQQEEIMLADVLELMTTPPEPQAQTAAPRRRRAELVDLLVNGDHAVARLAAAP
jgi:hypothetical protein